MGADRWQLFRTLVRSRGGGSPAGDIVCLAAVMAGIGVYAFVLGYLVRVAGPVVEDGTSPRTAVSVRFLLFGTVLLAIAVGLYQRRLIAWLGAVTFAVGGAVLSLATSLAASHAARPVALVSSLLLLGFLLARRNLFVEFR